MVPKLSPEERKAAIRKGMEKYMAARGWVRLVERADVWICLQAEGDDIHSVHLFWSAWALERKARIQRKQMEKKRARAIAALHRNPAALAATAARGSGHEGEDHG